MNVRSLRFIMTLSVLLINTASAFLTLLLILILGRWQPLSFLMLPQAAVISCIIIGTIISAIVYQRVLKPIDRLIKLTEAVKQGDYSVRVDPKPAMGNVATLIRSFNSMAEELGSVEMLKSDFIGTFSHEFKTPIASVKGFAKQLKRKDLTEEERQEYLDIIIYESSRLTAMSESVLLLSRMEHEQQIHNSTDFSLDEQLRHCILVLEKEWEEKDIAWNLELDPITIHSDPALIEHIWINLLGNAIKFSPMGGTITVRTVCTAPQSDPESAVSVTVRDEGPGMDEATASRIFEKFYQADRSRAGKGNGLGLSIVRQAIRLSGGSITVVSEPGHGSAFTVKLPPTPPYSTASAS